MSRLCCMGLVATAMGLLPCTAGTRTAHALETRRNTSWVKPQSPRAEALRSILAVGRQFVSSGADSSQLDKTTPTRKGAEGHLHGDPKGMHELGQEFASLRKGKPQSGTSGPKSLAEFMTTLTSEHLANESLWRPPGRESYLKRKAPGPGRKALTKLELFAGLVALSSTHRQTGDSEQGLLPAFERWTKLRNGKVPRPELDQLRTESLIRSIFEMLRHRPSLDYSGMYGDDVDSRSEDLAQIFDGALEHPEFFAALSDARLAADFEHAARSGEFGPGWLWSGAAGRDGRYLDELEQGYQDMTAAADQAVRDLWKVAGKLGLPDSISDFFRLTKPDDSI